MTADQWMTVVLGLIGVLINVGAYLWTRSMKALEHLQKDLTGHDGAVARIHGRIDALGETYVTKRESEMQFENLKTFLETTRLENTRQHQDSIARMTDNRTANAAENARIATEVKDLRTALDQRASGGR